MIRGGRHHWMALHRSAALAVILIHIYLIFKSTGAIRKRAIVTMLGIIILFLGVASDAELIYEAIPTLPIILPPIFRITGTLIVGIVQKYD